MPVDTIGGRLNVTLDNSPHGACEHRLLCSLASLSCPPVPLLLCPVRGVATRGLDLARASADAAFAMAAYCPEVCGRVGVCERHSDVCDYDLCVSMRDRTPSFTGRVIRVARVQSKTLKARP